MKLFIKNMASEECGLSVMAEIDKLKIQYNSVKLGQVNISSKLSEEQLGLLQANLLKIGFELMDDNKLIITEIIKQAIDDIVHYHNTLSESYLPEYLVWKTDYGFPYLSQVFLEETGTTIEQFFINCKMEFAKETMEDCRLNLSERTKKLYRKSVSHLSSQFTRSNYLALSEY